MALVIMCMCLITNPYPLYFEHERNISFRGYEREMGVSPVRIEGQYTQGEYRSLKVLLADYDIKA